MKNEPQFFLDSSVLAVIEFIAPLINMNKTPHRYIYNMKKQKEMVISNNTKRQLAL